MARHGENIRKRKDGRWEGRFLAYSTEKEKTVYRSVYAHFYQEVRRKMDVQKRLLQDDHEKTEDRISLSDIQFGDMAQEWFVEVQNERKPSTYTKYNIIYQGHIKQFFHDAVICEKTIPNLIQIT